MKNRNYWGYRIDTNRIKFLMSELHNCRLRQGWGWDKRQDLRNFQLDEGARRNRAMFKKVKKDDIILVPRLPSWERVAIVEATEDWSKGYYFEIAEEHGDYGHVFPAKYIKSFVRNNEHVSGNLRSTLGNASRFWNINHYAEDINKLLQIKQGELEKSQDHYNRLICLVGEVFNETFDEKQFGNLIYERFNNSFTKQEWEFTLVNGLKKVFPFYKIERVGGKNEKKHGTDILIKIPSLLDEYEYAIAIQVKDYIGQVSKNVINQIKKADSYWENENLILIDKWIIITRATSEANEKLKEEAGNVKIVFANELKPLLNKISRHIIEFE